MATWYAQKSGNLSANDVFFDAKTGGNAKDVSAQSDNTIVLAANGFTVAIDENFTALRLSTAVEDGSNAGGGFTVSSGPRVITAEIVAGTTSCVSASAGPYTLTCGALYGGTSSAARGISAVGSMDIVAPSATAGSGSGAEGVRYVSGSGGITINGSVIASTGAAGVNYLAWPVSHLVVNGGNLVNTASYGAVVGNKAPTYNPGPTNYVQFATTASTVKLAAQLTAAQILAGVANGTITGNVVLPAVEDVEDGVMFGAASALEGTLVAGGGSGGGPLVGSGGLVT